MGKHERIENVKESIKGMLEGIPDYESSIDRIASHVYHRELLLKKTIQALMKDRGLSEVGMSLEYIRDIDGEIFFENDAHKMILYVRTHKR